MKRLWPVKTKKKLRNDLSFEWKLKYISVTWKEPGPSLSFSCFLSALICFSGFLVAFAHCFPISEFIGWLPPCVFCNRRKRQSREKLTTLSAFFFFYLANDPRSYSSLTHIWTMILCCQVLNLKLIRFKKRIREAVRSLCAEVFVFWVKGCFVEACVRMER